MSSLPGSLVQLGEVVNDPDLAQTFLIQRSTWSWIKGVWQPGTTTETVVAYGVVSVAEPRDIEMVPEADRVKGMMVFYSSQPIYGTRGVLGFGQGNFDGPPGVGGTLPASSDILVWRGLNWRVLSVRQMVDYGYFKAIAVRMRAE
jgi:hypothetical protein